MNLYFKNKQVIDISLTEATVIKENLEKRNIKFQMFVRPETEVVYKIINMDEVNCIIEE